MDNKQHKLLMLSTQQLVMAFWPQVEPLLASAPIAEEFTPATIQQCLIAGQMICFVALKEEVDIPEVELVVLLAKPVSETFPVVTILTVAGKGLRKHVRKYWEAFKGWCFISGARAIDAYVPERMAKFLDKELGLKKETVHVRLRM